jgi:hypothetical protein
VSQEAQQNAVALAQRFGATFYPAAEVILLAGSASRGEASPTSDYDIVALYKALPEGASREMRTFEQRDFEVFAHDLGTLAYFCRELECPSGQPVLATMIIEGIEVISTSIPLLKSARQICREALQAGPSTLSTEALQSRRYVITDLLLCLLSPQDQAIQIACGSALYAALSDFALRAGGHWSAGGKAVPRTLKAVDPALANRFAAAFSSLFCESRTGLVEELVDAVLAPYGGLFRAGFRQTAPANWRDQFD